MTKNQREEGAFAGPLRGESATMAHDNVRLVFGVMRSPRRVGKP